MICMWILHEPVCAYSSTSCFIPCAMTQVRDVADQDLRVGMSSVFFSRFDIGGEKWIVLVGNLMINIIFKN